MYRRYSDQKNELGRFVGEKDDEKHIDHIEANFRFGHGSGLNIPTIGWFTPTVGPYPFDAGRCNAKGRQAAAAHHQHNLAIS